MGWNTEYTPTGETMTRVIVWDMNYRKRGTREYYYLPEDLEAFNEEADDRMKCAVHMALRGLDGEDAIVREDYRDKRFERTFMEVNYWGMRRKGKLTYRDRKEVFIKNREDGPDDFPYRAAQRRFAVIALRGEKMKHYTPGIGQRVTYGVGSYCFGADN